MDTQSRCEELQSELARSHQERGELINKCVILHKQRVEEAAGDRGKVRSSTNMVSSEYRIAMRDGFTLNYRISLLSAPPF